MQTPKYIHIASWIILVVVIGVVVLGAFTRLVHAGLGCPDWPTCYGHLWVPNSETEIIKANQNFSQTPVEVDKTWPEQAHRLLASSLGLLILGLYCFTFIKTAKTNRHTSIFVFLSILVAATIARIFIGDSIDFVLLLLIFGYFLHIIWLYFKHKSSPILPQKHTALLAGFVVLQGWFGMWTVTLNLWPQVVTTHLLGGFTTFILVWLLILRTANLQWLYADNTNKIKKLRPFAMLALVVVIIQIALGGWTTSNYAALACIDLPTCHNEWLPKMDFKEGFNFFQHVGPNYLGGIMDNAARTAIHFSHRVGAIITCIVVIVLSIKLFKVGLNQAKFWAGLLVVGLLMQVLLGVSNILFGLPLLIAVAHNAGGALLLLLVVSINYKIITAKAVSLAGNT